MLESINMYLIRSEDCIASLSLLGFRIKHHIGSLNQFNIYLLNDESILQGS